MSKKAWRRIEYWAVLVNPIIVILYFAGMKQLAGLCMYGGVRRRLPIIAACGIAGVLWLIGWTFYWHRRKHEQDLKVSGKKKVYTIVLLIDALLIIMLTGFYGNLILQSAQPYSGKLAWKIEELQTTKKVKLKHNNIYEDGIAGILEDLDHKLDLPEQLYTSNHFTVWFDLNGDITEIYSLMYGKDEDGESHTYLLDYNRGKGDKITVWVNDGGGEYIAEENLSTMLELYQLADGAEAGIRAQAEQAYFDYGAKQFRLRYMKYELSLTAVDKENISLHKWAEEEGLRELEQNKPTYTYEVGVCQRVPETEDLYYMVDASHGWKLVVRDAALGSRFYGLERTVDGGTTWHNFQDDPFGGNLGVAAGMIFFDEQLGFLLLSGASESHAELYVTRDGGLTISEVKLPKDGVTDIVSNLEEYDYTTLPVKEGDVLKAELRLEKYDCPRLHFESEDDGVTWKYTGFSND